MKDNYTPTTSGSEAFRRIGFLWVFALLLTTAAPFIMIIHAFTDWRAILWLPAFGILWIVVVVAGGRKMKSVGFITDDDD